MLLTASPNSKGTLSVCEFTLSKSNMRPAMFCGAACAHIYHQQRCSRHNRYVLTWQFHRMRQRQTVELMAMRRAIGGSGSLAAEFRILPQPALDATAAPLSCGDAAAPRWICIKLTRFLPHQGWQVGLGHRAAPIHRGMICCL